ncbi:unnamed protein product, partial [Eretmochelys imbricata]
KQTETQRQKIVSEVQQVCQLVEEKQLLLLAQLNEINKDILKRQNNYIAKITEEISRLDHLISELEGKCQQPASEILQDIRSTLSGGRQRTFENPVSLSPEFKWGSWDFSEKTRILHNILKNFKETLVSEWRLDK